MFNSRLGSIFLSLLLLFSIACRAPQKADLKSKLAAVVERKRYTNEQVRVRLKDLTDFEWDRVYVFTPYTSAEEIRRALGFTQSQRVDTSIEMLDSFNLLVFTNARKVVGYVEQPRHLGDFGDEFGATRKIGFSPSEANFRVELEDYGQPWLVLHLQNQ